MSPPEMEKLVTYPIEVEMAAAARANGPFGFEDGLLAGHKSCLKMAWTIISRDTVFDGCGREGQVTGRRRGRAGVDDDGTGRDLPVLLQDHTGKYSTMEFAKRSRITPCGQSCVPCPAFTEVESFGDW